MSHEYANKTPCLFCTLCTCLRRLCANCGPCTGSLCQPAGVMDHKPWPVAGQLCGQTTATAGTSASTAPRAGASPVNCTGTGPCTCTGCA